MTALSFLFLHYNNFFIKRVKPKADIAVGNHKLYCIFFPVQQEKHVTIAFCLKANFKCTTGSEPSLQMQNQMYVQQPVTNAISHKIPLM